METNGLNACIHCVNSLRTRTYSGPKFPKYGLNTPYSVRIRENVEQNNSDKDPFYAVWACNFRFKLWPRVLPVIVCNKMLGKEIFYPLCSHGDVGVEFLFDKFFIKRSCIEFHEYIVIVLFSTATILSGPKSCYVKMVMQIS